MTEFITRCCHAEERYEVIIKTDSEEHYEEAEQFARRLIGHEKPVTITNADRIRAMNDEELADFFFESPEIEFRVCEYCEYFGGHASDTPCKHDMGRCFVSAKNEAFKKWLQQPAEGD